MSSVPFRLGPYDCIHELGSGATASLYVARLLGVEGFEKIVAVKRIHEHVAQDGEFVRRFVDEAQIGAALGHANIVRVLECGADPATRSYYVATEFVDGISVQQLLTSLDRRGRRLPPATAAALVAGVADALDYAHQFTASMASQATIIHGGLRPSKILLPREGGVKVLDFGVADALAYAKRSAPDTDWAHCAYLAPETIQRGVVLPASDLFALGAILFELITADPLFLRGTAAATLNEVQLARVPNHPALPADLALLVKMLVAPEPEQRPPSAADVHDALVDWLAEQRMTPAAAWAAANLEEVFEDWPSNVPSSVEPEDMEWDEESFATVEIRKSRRATTVRVTATEGSAAGGGYDEEERTSEFLPHHGDPFDPLHALEDSLSTVRGSPTVSDLPSMGPDPVTDPAAWDPEEDEEYTTEVRYGAEAEIHMPPELPPLSDDDDGPTEPIAVPLEPPSPTTSQRVVDVIGSLEALLASRPGDPDLGTNLGALYRMRDRLEDAEATLSNVVDQHPGHGQAWYHLGLVRQRQQRFDEAKEAWSRAVEAEPDLIDARLALANLLLREGDTPSAIRELTTALATQWQSGRAHHLLVICYQQIGDLEAAAQHLDYAEQYGEDVAKLRERLGE